MTWARRGLLALPFAVAGLLNVLVILSRPLHWRTEHVAVFFFLFGTPWAWLVDRGWIGYIHSRWAEALVGYTLILWIPAFLYSGCLGLLMRILGFRAGRVRA
jgi:hypothetical protein